MARINIPFDVSYTISFSGDTKVDGVKTITPQIIRDKMLDVLEELMLEGYINEYRTSVKVNNLAEARKVIKRMGKKK